MNYVVLPARLQGLALLLATLSSCHKASRSLAPAPINTTRLTGPTGHLADSRVRANGVEGAYPPAASSTPDDKHAADNKHTSAAASGSALSRRPRHTPLRRSTCCRRARWWGR